VGRIWTFTWITTSGMWGLVHATTLSHLHLACTSFFNTNSTQTECNYYVYWDIVYNRFSSTLTPKPHSKSTTSTPTLLHTPKMPSPQFRLRTAHISDLPSIAHTWTTAFFDDEIIGQIMHPYRTQYPDDVYWFLLRGIRERFWDWRHRFIVVVADDESVVGAADWRRLGQGGEGMELSWGDPSELALF
jgi:hypothetical protein